MATGLAAAGESINSVFSDKALRVNTGATKKNHKATGYVGVAAIFWEGRLSHKARQCDNYNLK